VDEELWGEPPFWDSIEPYRDKHYFKRRSFREKMSSWLQCWARRYCGHEIIDLGKPSSTVSVDMQTIYSILRRRFPTEGEIFLSDSRNYKLCNLDDINKFLKRDLTNKMGFIANNLDCDDFALRLAGQFSIPNWSDLTIGLMWTNAHALNCLIDQNEDFWFLEPQTDELTQELKSWQGTTLRFIMI